MAVGDEGAPGAPGSRSKISTSAVAMSLKVEKHGEAGEHGAGVVALLITSDSNVLLSPAWSALITSCDGERLSRTNALPQPAITADVATAPSRPTNFGNFAVTVTSPLQPHDLWCDEDEQLAALIREFVALEQPAEQRQPMQGRRAVLARLLTAHVDAADDGRLAAADQHLRERALRVDRRDAVDRAAEVGRRVLHGDAHDHGIRGGNLGGHAQGQRRIAERHRDGIVGYGLNRNLD